MARDDAHLLTDIRIEARRHELRPIYAVAQARRAVRIPGSDTGRRSARDLALVTGRDNLAQAVILRLLTPRGELAALGHPDYGSRLHQLVGRPNSENTRGLVRLHILESLGREPRIEEITGLRVEPHSEQRDRVDVELEVRPAATTQTVTIGPFTLNLGA